MVKRERDQRDQSPVRNLAKGYAIKSKNNIKTYSTFREARVAFAAERRKDNRAAIAISFTIEGTTEGERLQCMDRIIDEIMTCTVCLQNESQP